LYCIILHHTNFITFKYWTLFTIEIIFLRGENYEGSQKSEIFGTNETSFVVQKTRLFGTSKFQAPRNFMEVKF